MNGLLAIHPAGGCAVKFCLLQNFRTLPPTPRLRGTLLIGFKSLRRIAGMIGKIGAGEGIRTLDINLGKVALYP